MSIFVIWYIIGVISSVILIRYIEYEFLVKHIFHSLLMGVAGVIMSCILIVILLSDVPWRRFFHIRLF